MNYNVILWTQFEISVVPIGRGFSFFLVMEELWKIIVAKSGHSDD